MADVHDPVDDHLREQVRLRALAREDAWSPLAPRALLVAAIAVAILLHLGAALSLYFMMQRPSVSDRDRIEVRLLDAAPAEPVLPEPPLPPPAKAAASVRPNPAPPVPVRPTPTPPSAAPASEAAPAVTATLFNADGSVRLPPASVPARAAPHEERIQRGREMMARGLDCTAHGPDDLAHRESAGEEVARKYLSWIGLYNPAAAEHRAEEEEKRQTRCRMWNEAGR